MSELWKQLHIRALNHKEDHDIAFLMNFIRTIPRYTSGCHCKEHFLAWRNNNPVEYGPNYEYFKWTVRAHNAVNEKLGKATMSYEEAFNLYKQD
jgi:hypothetical protein